MTRYQILGQFRNEVFILSMRSSHHPAVAQSRRSQLLFPVLHILTMVKVLVITSLTWSTVTYFINLFTFVI